MEEKAPPNRVRELREGKSLTLAQLADLSGVPKNGINLIENGEQELTVTKMRKLAKPLGVAPSALLVDEDVEYRSPGGQDLAGKLAAIPPAIRAGVVHAVSGILEIAQELAASANETVGTDEESRALSVMWQQMDPQSRTRALGVLTAAGLAEAPRGYRHGARPAK